MNSVISAKKLSDPELNACNCCKGLDVKTPVLVDNRPGLDTLNYRIGTHALFKQSMLARISGSRDDPKLQAALSQLKTKEDNDFSIALLDAWAVVSDVLTFYQERIANESYLLTSRERFSLLHLARLIGYELRPGSAASTYLAFTMEEPKVFANLVVPGVPDNITLEPGIKIQSVPGPGESAQIFETIEKIECRGRWNNVKPRLTKKQQLTSTTDTIFLDGIGTNLKPGDGLLFKVNNEDNYVFGLVAKVEISAEDNYTKVLLHSKAELKIAGLQDLNLQGNSTQQNTLSLLVTGNNEKTLLSSKLEAVAAAKKLKVQEIFDNLAVSPKPSPKVLVFRTRAMVFGHNAPPWKLLPISLRGDEPVYKINSNGTVSVGTPIPGIYKEREGTWADSKLLDYSNFQGKDKNKKYLYLDNIYPNIARGSFVILKNETTWSIYKIEDLTELSVSDFTFSTKVTRLTLHDINNNFNNFSIRTTTVFGQIEELSLSRVTEEESFPGDGDFQNDKECLRLEGWINGLYPGQHIIVSGEVHGSSGSGIKAVEHAIIDKVEHVLTLDGYTQISLKQKLKNKYVRSTVSINGNVALATHGETRQEVLGSGNAQPYQRFTLKQPPLTYLTADTPSGVESTLEVRVNDVLWHEVPTLYGHGPEERIYETHLDNEGKSIIQFGDGKTGSLLSTGQENIRATYRRGIGLEGLVKADQLSLLMTRPLGLSSVTNPFDSDGAADPEKENEARQNAPLTVMTLDRIVSLKDYEDFARSFTGISKALATWTWEGHRRKIFLTVSGPEGAELKSDSPIIDKLKTAISKTGDPQTPIKVESYKKVYFKIAADINVLPDYIPNKVLKTVTEALRDTFSFSKREFGQAVKLSEVTANIQNVTGVHSANVLKLYRSDPSIPQPNQIPPPDLEASMPVTGSRITAAELLILDPGPLTELEVS